MRVRALAKEVGVSPRKVRLVINLVKDMKVEEALGRLRFVPTPAARAVAKVVKSAAANAENNYQMTPADLRIVDIYANEARLLKRSRPQARGRVAPILKRASHITVVVEEEG